MKTQTKIRAAFWREYFPDGKPREYRGKTQNQLPADVRMAFVDYVDSLQKSGEISEALAERATL